MEQEQEKIMCPLCHCVDEVQIEGSYVKCPYCGEFLCDYSAQYLLESCPKEFNDDDRLIVRYAVKKKFLEKLRLGNKITLESLTEPRIEEIISNNVLPKLQDKSLLVLAYLFDNTDYFGKVLTIDIDTLFPLFFCRNNTEFHSIMMFLNEVGLINIEESSIMPQRQSSSYSSEHYRYNYVIEKSFYHEYCEYMTYPSLNVVMTNDGFEYYNDKTSSTLSTKGFVAMWFNNVENLKEDIFNMQKVFDKAIKPAIESANENKYYAMKIDCKEHCNDINDEMIAEIRKSKFLVADLTGYRGGVYFEAGFAYGLGKPVIYTCNREWFNAKRDANGNVVREGVHFDLNHRNTILWDYDKLEDFAKALKSRIEAVVI